jgi:hypothetical protein
VIWTHDRLMVTRHGSCTAWTRRAPTSQARLCAHNWWGTPLNRLVLACYQKRQHLRSLTTHERVLYGFKHLCGFTLSTPLANDAHSSILTAELTSEVLVSFRRSGAHPRS